VYAGWWIWEGQRRPGVINVGRERGPQLDPAPRTVVEIHVFDFEGNLVGEGGEVEFTAFLRGEMSFGAKDELAAQIRRDADRARDLLATPT
jgi:riboflavin kinase/FMN adenylyltransferase